MVEEPKVPPKETPPAPPAPAPAETGAKSADELVKELKAENEGLKKRATDQESFIGRQSTELGELRKVKPEEPTKETQDALQKEIVEDLIKDGYTKEAAEENAKVLSKTGGKIVARELNKRVGVEAKEMVQDILDDPNDKRMDGVIFKDNETEIMAELSKRRLSPTARGNVRIFRECYNDVVRRKADKMKTEQKPIDEEKRAALIAEGASPPPGAKEPPATDEEKKYVEGIKNAGASPEKAKSAFF